MSKVQFGSIIGFLAIIVFVQLAPIIAPDRTAPRYEYRIEDIKDEELGSSLRRLGDGGFDIVFARRALVGEGQDREGAYEIIFRRPY
jgi:hypothetical protein